MASSGAPEDDWSDSGCAERVGGAIGGLTRQLHAAAVLPAPDDLAGRLQALLLDGAFADALALCRAMPRDRATALFLAVIRRLEARWQADTVEFAALGFAFFQMRRLIELVTEPAPPPPPQPAALHDSPRLLVALAPGERHAFGAQILASELALHGWAVELDLSGDAERICARVAAAPYHAVGLSVGHDTALQGLADHIADLRLRSCRGGISVMLGGGALAEPRTQYRFLGADVVALTAAEAMVWLSAHLALARPRLRN